jgi:hypothetical protein
VLVVRHQQMTIRVLPFLILAVAVAVVQLLAQVEQTQEPMAEAVLTIVEVEAVVLQQ